MCIIRTQFYERSVINRIARQCLNKVFIRYIERIENDYLEIGKMVLLCDLPREEYYRKLFKPRSVTTLT